jgi:hypothetical protein
MLAALYIAREKVLILLESFQSTTADPSPKGSEKMKPLKWLEIVAGDEGCLGVRFF